MQLAIFLSRRLLYTQFASPRAAAKNSCRQFIFDDVYSGFRHGSINTFASPSSSVANIFGGRGQNITRASVTGSGSLANTRRRRTPWKQNSSSSDHLSWRLHGELFGITALYPASNERIRNRIDSSIYGSRSLAFRLLHQLTAKMSGFKNVLFFYRQKAILSV